MSRTFNPLVTHLLLAGGKVKEKVKMLVILEGISTDDNLKED